MGPPGAIVSHFRGARKGFFPNFGTNVRCHYSGHPASGEGDRDRPAVAMLAPVRPDPLRIDEGWPETNPAATGAEIGDRPPLRGPCDVLTPDARVGRIRRCCKCRAHLGNCCLQRESICMTL